MVKCLPLFSRMMKESWSLNPKSAFFLVMTLMEMLVINYETPILSKLFKVWAYHTLHMRSTTQQLVGVALQTLPTIINTSATSKGINDGSMSLVLPHQSERLSHPVERYSPNVFFIDVGKPSKYKEATTTTTY